MAALTVNLILANLHILHFFNYERLDQENKLPLLFSSAAELMGVLLPPQPFEMALADVTPGLASQVQS